MVERTQVDRRTLRLYQANAANAIPNVVNRLNEVGLNPISLTLTQPTLDDVFLQVTGSNFAIETEEDSAPLAKPA